MNLHLLEALYLLNPILIAFVVTMVLSCLLPAGYLKFPYNITAIIGSVFLAWRGCCLIENGNSEHGPVFFEGLVVNDAISGFAAVFLGIAGVVFFTMSPRYLERKGMHTGEFYLLSLVSMAGMVLTVCTRNFTGLILGIETMTIPLYFLISMDKSHNNGRLAALKYLVLGGVGTAILVFGVSLIYGATGSLAYGADLADKLDAGTAKALYALGSVFLMGGFLFKTGAFPFQTWVPDVYGSAPTPLTGFMATTVKLAAVLALFNLFKPILGNPNFDLITTQLLPVVAVITMTLGNLMALRHKNPKVVLAYSSIAHTGYLLVAFCSNDGFAQSGILYYIAVYVLMTLGAFAVLSSVPDDDPKYLQGAIHRRPILAIFFSICILSLAGIPPFGGFIGKLMVFQGAWGSGNTLLVGLAILNSLIALGYYIPMLRWMLFEEPGSKQDQTSNNMYLYVATAICTLGVVVTGVNPEWLTDMIEKVI